MLSLYVVPLIFHSEFRVQCHVEFSLVNFCLCVVLDLGLGLECWCLDWVYFCRKTENVSAQWNPKTNVKQTEKDGTTTKV